MLLASLHEEEIERDNPKKLVLDRRIRESVVEVFESFAVRETGHQSSVCIFLKCWLRS